MDEKMIDTMVDSMVARARYLARTVGALQIRVANEMLSDAYALGDGLDISGDLLEGRDLIHVGTVLTTYRSEYRSLLDQMEASVAALADMGIDSAGYHNRVVAEIMVGRDTENAKRPWVAKYVEGSKS